jgi:hypothetical protein
MPPAVTRWFFLGVAILVLVLQSIWISRTNLVEQFCGEDAVTPTKSTTKSTTTLSSVMSDLLQVDPDAALKLLESFTERDELWDQHHDVVTSLVDVIVRQEGVLPWIDLDLSQGEPLNCGGNKCLYASLSQPDQAYLITRRTHREADSFSSGVSYQVEMELVREYGIPRLSLEPPYPLFNASAHMVRLLHAYGHFRKNDRTINATTAAVVYVQRIKRVPQPYLDVHESKSVLKNLPAFAQQLQKLKASDTNAVTTFRRHFLAERERLYKMLNDDPQLLWLIHDFQFLLTLDGTWYHMDFDRKFSVHQQKFPSSDDLQKMYKKLNRTLDNLLFWITRPDQDTIWHNFTDFCVTHYKCRFNRGPPQHQWDHCWITC